MLRKSVYPNEYMIEKYSVKHLCLKKQGFYCNLSIEDITNADYSHTKKVWEGFEMKK